MNIISCDGCGIVIDKDKLDFPEIGEYRAEDCVWIGDSYTAYVKCPVCSEQILEDSE